MTRRPRLLFLCQTLPDRPDGGVWMRTYHAVRLLAQAFDITALCFERAGSGAGSRPRMMDHPSLHDLADVQIFDLPQKHSRARFVWDHLRSTMRRRVYTAYLYDSQAFRERLTALLQTRRFDLVHADSLDLAQYFPVCAGLPIVCVHHDIESDLLRRRAAIEPRWWRRLYLKYQSWLMQQVEDAWCDRIALNVVVSEHDADVLKRRAPRARIAVVPNGVDTQEFQPDGVDGDGVAYVGGTTPAPNLDALNFFCESILPHLRTNGTPIPTRWIGRASIDQQEFYRKRYGVQLTGYVEDVRPFMRGAACHVVPLRAGGGTRLKILTSWAMGKPVVSTTLGCEGLAARDGDNILIRDDPRAFAQAVHDVLGNEDLRRRLAASGRATAERLYSWDVIGEQMIAAYLSLAQKEPETPVRTLERAHGEARRRYA
jgi:glycosyltransferase involved in cell wall biosynthesis